MIPVTFPGGSKGFSSTCRLSNEMILSFNIYHLRVFTTDVRTSKRPESVQRIAGAIKAVGGGEDLEVLEKRYSVALKTTCGGPDLPCFCLINLVEYWRDESEYNTLADPLCLGLGLPAYHHLRFASTHYAVVGKKTGQACWMQLIVQSGSMSVSQFFFFFFCHHLAYCSDDFVVKSHSINTAVARNDTVT